MLRLQLANSRADICAPLCLIQNLHALPLLFVTAFYRWKEGSREWLGHNKTGMWIADSSSGGESLANLALGGEWERNFYYVQAIVLDWPESLFRFFLLLLFSPSRVRFFEIPWTAAHQASRSFTISQSLLKLTSIESVMSCNHLILCRSLLLLPSVFPSIRVFTSESVLCIRWPKY